MNAAGPDEYLGLITRDPGEVCVEKCVLLCRSLLAAGRDDGGLNSSGARHGSAQGIRVHAALGGVGIPEGEEIHLVDWNASQGFHSVAMLEELIVRGSIDMVRHVTLVHPDQRALDRARAAVKCLVGRCGIDTVARHLPGRSGMWPALPDFKSPVVVHILGDCLTRPGIDFPLLARMIAAPGHRHLVVCADEFIEDNANFRRLISLLPGVRVLSACSAKTLTFTSDRRPVGCRTMALYCEPEERPPFPAEDEFTEGDEHVAMDVDSAEGLARWCGAGADMRDFFGDLRQVLSPGDRLLPSPSLPPYEADVAVVRPHRGILLLSILNASPLASSFETEATRAADALRDMRRLLAKHLPGLIGRRTVRDIIRLAVVVPGTLTASLPPVVLGGDVRLIAPDALHTEEGNEIFRQVLPIAATPLFGEDNAVRALELLFPAWHRAVLGRAVRLDDGQVAAAAYPSVTQRVLGSPGSGKTMCLLLKAAKIWTHRHRPVLVTVPDATALCAVRRSLRTVFADFPPGQIHILAYTDLARIKVAEETQMQDAFRRGDAETALAAEPEGRYTRAGRRLHPRYCAILVDDAHAFSPLELESLRLNWLAPGGEMCLFANPLEAAHLDLPMENAVMLTGNYSPVASETAPLIARLAGRLNPSLPQSQEAGSPSAEVVSHINVREAGFGPLAEAVLDALSGYADRDVMLVADEEKLLRLMQIFLEQEGEHETMTTFTPAEAERSYGSAVRNPRGMSALHADSLRHQFDTASPALKLAQTSHLQGVNSPCVIYLYCRGRRPDYRAIYRTATRATRRLIIISYPDSLT